MVIAALVFAVLSALSTALLVLSRFSPAPDGLNGFFEMISAALFGLVASVLLVVVLFQAQRRGVPVPSQAVLAGGLLILSLVVGVVASR